MSKKECVILISTDLALRDREALIAVLDHERGVSSARFSYPDLKTLSIQFDTEAFSPTTLLNLIKRHHVAAQIIDNKTPQIERILVAIDRDNQSDETINYVGRIAAGHTELPISLYSRLPGIPPELREHGGSENPTLETELGRQLAKQVESWRSKRREEEHRLLEDARKKLITAGVGNNAICQETSWEASLGESLAEALLRVAHASGCHTIALSRSHYSLIQELTHHHASDTLAHIGTGMTIWIID